MKLRVSIFLVGLFMLCGCEENQISSTVDLKKSYYPLKLNSVLVYDVDSTAYNDFTGHATNFQFELKDTTVARLGDNSFRIERFKREAGGDWVFQKVFARTVAHQRAEEFIRNQRFVRLVFPPSLNKTWNGNLYNNLGEQEYSLTELDLKQTINGLSFDSTAVVTQIDVNNLVREDFAADTYAKNIGLVQRKVKAVDKNITTGQIRRGFKYLMKIKSYR